MSVGSEVYNRRSRVASRGTEVGVKYMSGSSIHFRPGTRSVLEKNSSSQHPTGTKMREQELAGAPDSPL